MLFRSVDRKVHSGDGAAGQLLGLTLGAYFVCRAGASGQTPSDQYEARKFDGAQFVGTDDFDWRLQYSVTSDAQAPEPPRLPPAWAMTLNAQMNVAQAPLLAKLWTLAKGEWP